MRRYLCLAGIVAVFSLGLAGSAAAGETGYEPMKPFEPYMEHIWSNEMPGGVINISQWEFILGGKAVQNTHSANDGEYGGTTIYFYDEQAGDYIYHYFTNAGFHTVGRVEFADGKMVSLEEVYGSDITEVKGITYIKDGKMVIDSEYKKDGEWGPGHSFVAEPAPDATIQFNK